MDTLNQNLSILAAHKTEVELLLSVLVGVATLVIAYSTWKYAVLTKRLVDETHKMRRAQTEPHVSIFLQGRDPTNVVVDLVLRNDGFAQARNLEFEIEPDCYYYKNRRLSDIAFLKPLSSLQPNETRKMPILQGAWRQELKDPSSSPESVSVRASYEDIMGNRKQETFVLPFESYLTGEEWGAEPLARIAGSLETIATQIQKMESRRES